MTHPSCAPFPTQRPGLSQFPETGRFPEDSGSSVGRPGRCEEGREPGLSPSACWFHPTWPQHLETNRGTGRSCELNIGERQQSWCVNGSRVGRHGKRLERHFDSLRVKNAALLARYWPKAGTCEWRLPHPLLAMWIWAQGGPLCENTTESRVVVGILPEACLKPECSLVIHLKNSGTTCPSCLTLKKHLCLKRTLEKDGLKLWPLCYVTFGNKTNSLKGRSWITAEICNEGYLAYHYKNVLGCSTLTSNLSGRDMKEMTRTSFRLWVTRCQQFSISWNRPCRTKETKDRVTRLIPCELAWVTTDQNTL